MGRDGAVPFNDLTRGVLANDPDARTAVDRVLASGWYVHGPEHAAFEVEFADYLGVDGVAGVASGSEALELALLAVGCGPGSVVMVAPNAGGYASVAAARVGARVVYADVDPTTHVLTAETVASAIDSDITAVVATHLYGNVVDIDRIRAVCEPFGARIVEDCAQATGAYSRERRVGSLADAAAFSFYPTKNLGAAGDGGAVASNDARVLDSVRTLRQYGWTDRYTIGQPHGMNSRLDEMQAALLRVGLRRLDRDNARRRTIVERYADALIGTSVQMVTEASPSSACHLAVVQTASPTDRDALRGHLLEHGVQTQVHYPIPDHRQSALPSAVRPTTLPVATELSDRILSLPCFPGLTDDEVEQVCAALLKA